MRYRIKNNNFRIKLTLGVIAWFGLSLFFGLKHNEGNALDDYHRELRADKSGYNVFLPALFIYHFNGNAMPDSIEVRAGYGFTVDKERNKIITKYPYGVAILEAPFWIAAHVTAPVKDGYSSVEYYNIIDWAASFYFAIGLLFVYLCARFYFKQERFVFTGVFVVLPLATNLFYYASSESGMSHIYSFFSIAGFMYFYVRSLRMQDYKLFFIAILFFALSFVIRPVNIIFLWILLFIDCNSWNSCKERIVFLLHPRNLFTIIGICAFFYTPQLAYNYYVTGKLSFSLYHDEAFTNFFAKKILEVLFATQNGIFTYVPAFVFVIAGIIILIKEQRFLGIASAYILIVYLLFYSSWWSYFLGCGFGHRGLIDFYPLFIFAIIAYFSRIQKNKPLFLVSSLLLLLFMIITTIMSREFDCCYYGKGDWDWAYYFKQVLDVFR